MLHGTIRNTALQHCCDFVPHGCNTIPTLQRCVALKNRRFLVEHRLYRDSSRYVHGVDKTCEIRQ